VKRSAPHVPPPRASDGGVTIHNRLNPGHPYQAAVDQVFRLALDGLPGPWAVSASSVGRAWFRIDVVAPDGASWSMSVPVQHGPRPEDLGETVRAACVRHCRVKRARGRPRAPFEPALPEGTPK